MISVLGITCQYNNYMYNQYKSALISITGTDTDDNIIDKINIKGNIKLIKLMLTMYKYLI